MRILSIETSCDETAISIIEAEGGSNDPHFAILSHALISQADIHKEFGGVYPSLAKREHSKNLPILLKSALEKADIPSTPLSIQNEQTTNNIQNILERDPDLAKELLPVLSELNVPEIDFLAVTVGPGLEPALWTGINFARVLSVNWNIPLIPVNHMEGHIYIPLLDGKNIEFPALALLISGGHTELVYVSDWGSHQVIGKTLDDAVGEAYDKVARMLSLPYPGGPEISKLAEEDRLDSKHKTTQSKNNPPIRLPRPMINSNDFNFSFSGLKTAVLYTLKKIPKLSKETTKEIAREFEDSVIEVLIHKTTKALEQKPAKTLILGGGVAANIAIRRAFEEMEKDASGTKLVLPDNKYATDNAVMIGIGAYVRYIKDKGVAINKDDERFEELRADGNLSL
jgi:N6-L-threonylcarbamoyladenine synthase